MRNGLKPWRIVEMTFVSKSTIYESFRNIALQYPNKIAIAYLGTRFTYAELISMAERLAAGLSSIGLGSKDRIVMYIPNGVQFVVAWLGIQRLGGVAVPVTPIYTVGDLDYISRDTSAKAVICSDRNYGYVADMMGDGPVESAIVTGLADLLPFYKRLFGWVSDKVPTGRVDRDGSTHFMVDLMKVNGPPAPDPETSSDDIAEILYTGGTTKRPKGVPIKHDLFLISSLEQLSVRDPLFTKDRDIILGGAPLFHILGQTCSLATIVVGGGAICLQPRMNLDAIFESIQRMKCLSLIGVPALYRMILEHDRVDQYDLSSLKYCFSAGDTLPEEVAKRWRSRFDMKIYQGYGATETCGGISMSPTDRESPTLSMGLPTPSKKIMIVEPKSLAPVNQGEPGELLVNSDPMVEEYWNKPEETEASFVRIDQDLYYRTSDIVREDEEGFLYFVDRTVDTIKHKGYRISASEIEAALQEHPAVIESCVIGLPDPKVGQRIKAFVVLKKDVKGITGYELTKFCREKLVNYKIPQYIEFRDMLPKSKVGKMLRREVRSGEKKRLET
jgi:long-chain acyl-CoA synthetase